ncbi:MAG: BatD family protein [Endomicrobiaceae bacterium]|nr:BatD family protein [Endomicrobiaceae bacterium]MDD5101530.1 BatD family protein [Endomicrobiaceae bacterium]
MKIKFIYVAVICFICSVFSYADNIQMKSSVSSTSVPLNEAFQLTISISGDSRSLPDFSAPTLKDFNTYASSQSKNFSIINGKISNAVNYVYTLGPKKIGEYEIPSFKLTYNGETYETQPIKITIEPAKNVNSVSVQNTQVPQYKQSPSQVYNFDTSKAVFVQANVDKKTAYVNEKITYTFAFYTSVNLLSNPSYQAPNFTGFFNGQTSQNNYRTKINGRDYIVTEVSTELFPQQEGLITIGSSVIQVSIEDFAKAQDDFFSSFFRRSKNVELSTDKININVLKVPENIDMVGNFDINVNVDNKQKKENEPFDLKIVVSGNGNIKTIQEPEIVLSDNLKKYETSEKILVNDNKETGKEFTTLIMPLNSGEGEIRILSGKYFDPKIKQIKNLKTKIIKVNVLEDSANKEYKQELSTGVVDQTDFKNLQQQIPQNINLSFIFKVYAFFKKPILWILLGIILFIMICIKIFLRYKKYINKDQQKLKNKKAYKKSKKYFQKAKKTKNNKEFYLLMYKGLLEYFASVLAKSADGLTAYKIRKDLEEKNIDIELINSIEGILEECTTVLYSQAKHNDSLKFEEFYDKTFEILKKLDI